MLKLFQNRSGGFIAGVILAASVLLGMIIIASKDSPQAQNIAPPVPTVRVISAQPQTQTPVATLYGRVNSPSLATLVSSVTANVMQVLVLPGDAVEKGQLLIQLDQTEARLALAQASARARDAAAQYQLEKQRQETDRKQFKREQELTALAKKSFERSQNLFAQKLISQAHLDTAQEQYQRQAAALENRDLAIRQHQSRLEALAAAEQSAKASEQQAQLDLSRTAITSPFAGLVVEVPVAVGDRVRNNQTLATVYDQQQLEIRALIPNRYLAGLRQAIANGEQPNARVLATGLQQLQIPLARLASAVRPGAGGVDGYFRLPTNSGLELNRNLALLLNLPPTDNAIVVPPQALFGLDAIFTVDSENRLQHLNVERLGDGLDDNGNKAVIVRAEGLTAGTRVLATQLPSAVSGLLVNAISAE